MQTDVRPGLRLTEDELTKLTEPRPVPSRRWGRAPLVGVAALLLAVAGIVALGQVEGDGDATVRTAPAVNPGPGAVVLGETETAPPLPSTVPTIGASPAPSVATTVPTASATTVPPAPAASTPPTTVPACRNSTDPACGPFRFDPQPGADSPMTVEVVAEPASPRVGQQVVYRITLRDPDGVSYRTSSVSDRNAGISGTFLEACNKYGPWDPPARDASQAVQTQAVPRIYSAPGTHTTTFAFEAGPFDCADSATGRGDRSYASSASGTVTVVVTP